LTAMHRPELIEEARQAAGLSRQDEAFLKQACGGGSTADPPQSAKKL
jgi:tRNA (guanine37-N1)-methyltransferase